MTKTPPIADLQRLLLALHPLGPLLGPLGLREDGGGPALPLDSLNAGDAELERRIHAEFSYGRQLRIVIGALDSLLDGTGAADDPRLADFRAMAARLRAIEADARSQRIARVRHALAELAAWRTVDPDAYAELAGQAASTLGIEVPEASNGSNRRRRA
jgi:hypothetical protein